jgi:hypothetical protein
MLDVIRGFRQNPDMSSDEREIYHYLQTWGVEFISAKEVSRRAGTKKRYHEDPDWAKPLLMAMAERGLLESDAMGRFRIKPEQKKGRKQRWVSPDIEQILKDKGVDVDGSESDPAAEGQAEGHADQP